jgi:hypothetical protein
MWERIQISKEPTGKDGLKPAAVRRFVGQGSALVALGLAMAACDGGPLSPEAMTAEPCRVPDAVASTLVWLPFAPDALRPALLHAAGPMSWALGSDKLTGELVQATAQLGSDLGTRSADTECRVLKLAAAALARLPDDPATRPDRDVISLVLTLAAHSLAQERKP